MDVYDIGLLCICRLRTCEGKMKGEMGWFHRKPLKHKKYEG